MKDPIIVSYLIYTLNCTTFFFCLLRIVHRRVNYICEMYNLKQENWSEHQVLYRWEMFIVSIEGYKIIYTFLQNTTFNTLTKYCTYEALLCIYNNTNESPQKVNMCGRR